MKASSSRITSSVFQITTRSSKLDSVRASTRGEREREREDDRQETHHKHKQHKKRTHKKWKQNKRIMVNCKKKRKENPHTAHTHGTRQLGAASHCTYPLTNMSLDFSPVK